MIVQPIESARTLLHLTSASPRTKASLATLAPEPQPSRLGLIGREQELALLHTLVEHVPAMGSALLIRGAPGTGKSALVAALVEDVRAQPVAILRAAGTRAEASLPYAGLHLLLRPILGELGSLPRPKRRAVEAAFGNTVATPPDPFLVATATLDLLSMAARKGLVIVVEDAQWLDRRTSEVLSFVARRIASDPMVLLVTARDDRRSPILEAGLDELSLVGLADDQSAQLLATMRPEMARPVCDRLIQIAAGNPLALIELHQPLTTDQVAGRAPLPDPVPLTARLQRAVGARTGELPVVTRRLLRILAHHDGAEVADVLGAYESLYPGEPVALNALLPAVVAGVIVLDQRTARFRDRLVWTSVYQGSTPADCRAARETLAAARSARASRETGAAPRSVVDVEPGQPNDGARARLIGLRDSTSTDIADPSMTPDPIDLAGVAIDNGDLVLARRLLWAAARHILWESGDPDARLAARGVAARIDAQSDDPWLLAIAAALGTADPASITVAAGRFERRDVAASDLLLVGISAAISGDVARSRLLVARAGPALRSDEDRELMAQLLVLQSWNDIHLGRWDEAASEIAQGAELARDTRQATLSLLADVAGALVASLRGDEESVDLAFAGVGLAAAARGQGWLASTIEVLRGVTDLSAGRADAAYERLRERLTSPEGGGCVWAVDHFADAAVLTGNVDEGRVILAALGEAAAVPHGPLQAAALAYAEAVLADEPSADERQEGAIARLAPWPVHQARLQLHRGAWLRRHRRVADSRPPLRAARDRFEALGAGPLAERARRELRASGERSRQRDVTAWDQLSPQETEIAQLAAQGLSNREIGEQLFLSHRTVGAHLYRIFPKLGVTSRGQLHTVLAAGASGASGGMAVVGS